MTLLLDTHAFLWFVLDDPRLSDTARDAMTEPENLVLVSPATYWEIAIKVSLQKLDIHTSYQELLRIGIDGNQFQILPIEPRHTSVLIELPHHHRDPFDRLLVAQATAEGVPLVSGDIALDAYQITRIW